MGGMLYTEEGTEIVQVNYELSSKYTKEMDNNIHNRKGILPKTMDFICDEKLSIYGKINEGNIMFLNDSTITNDKVLDITRFYKITNIEKMSKKVTLEEIFKLR